MEPARPSYSSKKALSVKNSVSVPAVLALSSSPPPLFLLLFLLRSHYVAHAGLKLTEMPLPLPQPHVLGLTMPG